MTKSQSIAQSILERMGIAIANQITLTVQGVPFTFNRNDEAYAELQTMVGKGESAVGLKQYLLDIVAEEDRENLLEVVNVPGFLDAIVPVIREKFIPQFEVTVKN